jgi:signal transduction histidine kinase/CheY-like chemotaxis protein/HPt (histidine-containing phosphotransfer) domain-containing protein
MAVHNIDSAKSSAFQGVVLASAILIGVTLLNGAYAIIIGNRNTNSMISNTLEERLNSADSVLQYELRELDFVGGIVQEQEQKIINYLDFDKLRPIQVMLQTIASKQNMDEVFFLDEDKELLVTNNRIVSADEQNLPYSNLVENIQGKAGLEQFPSSFFHKVSSQEGSNAGWPEMLTVMKLIVPMYHDLGEIYGYVVLIKFIDNNQSIARRLAEATHSPFVIFNNSQLAILSNLTSAAIPYPEDDLLPLAGTTYISKLQPLYDLTGSELAELGVLMDQQVLLKQRIRQIFNIGLPLAVIICIAVFLLLMMDKLKKSYRQLDRARQEAEAANIAKSDFLANMSHEIRTPLNAIVGLGGLALKTKLSTQQHDYLIKIRSSSNVLLGIINNILDFSKIEARKLVIEAVIFRCSDILRNVENIALAAAEEKDIKLIFDTSSKVPQHLQGDPMRIFQVLLNLTTNAIKFTLAGEVVIKTEIIPDQSEQEKNCVLQFSVQDSGIGLSKEQLETLFDAFTQADSSTTRKFGGTGLGLTICKELVEMMGGELTVVSEPDKGSLFSFTVLVQQVEGLELGTRVENAAKAQLDTVRGASILLVEDNEINQQVASEFLQSEGFLVTVVGNGLEAVEVLTSPAMNNHFDLILMDIQMPIMDGYSATKEIRDSQTPYKNIPIVAMTAHALSSQRRQCLDSGMNDHVSKPFDPEILFSVLAKWIPSQQHKVGAAQASSPGREPDQVILPATLPGLDIHDGLRRVAGNRTLYLSILSSFHKKSNDCCGRVQHALQNSREEEAKRLLHRLKGAAGNTGALELYQSAGELESAIGVANSGQLEKLNKNFRHALQIVSQSIQRLEALQPEHFNEKIIPKGDLPISQKDVTSCCDDLRQLITNDYGAAIDAISSLKDITDQAGLADKVDELEQLLEEFQEEEALLCLNELEHSLLEAIH